MKSGNGLVQKKRIGHYKVKAKERREALDFGQHQNLQWTRNEALIGSRVGSLMEKTGRSQYDSRTRPISSNELGVKFG